VCTSLILYRSLSRVRRSTACCLKLHHYLCELSELRAMNTLVTTCNSINLGPRVVLLVQLSFRADPIDSQRPSYLDER
jgi:hypothetical protein